MVYGHNKTIRHLVTIIIHRRWYIPKERFIIQKLFYSQIMPSIEAKLREPGSLAKENKRTEEVFEFPSPNL